MTYTLEIDALTVAGTQPWLIGRQFKRRFGDDTPFVLGDDRWTADELTGHLFDWVVTQATTLEGSPPNHVVVTHPASWSTHRLQLLERATSGYVSMFSALDVYTRSQIVDLLEQLRDDFGADVLEGTPRSPAGRQIGRRRMPPVRQ